MRVLFLALLVFPVSAAASAQSPCYLAPTVLVTGTVEAVFQAPAAPLNGVAVGDAFEMTLGFEGDVACVTSFHLPGFLALPECLEMTVGGVTVAADPLLADRCIWGEIEYTSDEVLAVVPFAGGDVEAELSISDGLFTGRIGLFDIIEQTLFVPNLNLYFSVHLVLRNATGAMIARIDVLELSGTSGILEANNYCMANANSTGVAARMGALGSPIAANNDLTLVALGLPDDRFTFFIVGSTQGFTPNPAGSSGNVCVGGGLGRYVGPGQIQSSGSQGVARVDVDLMNTPQPGGFVPTQPGMTWNFTAWFRDVNAMGVSTSNFADGLSLTFQ